MSKKWIVLSVVLASGFWLCCHSATDAKEKKSAAGTKAAGGDVVIFADDFNTAGKLGAWSVIKRVTGHDVADGHVLMVNDKNKVDASGDPDPTTSLLYAIGDYNKDIIIEAKFDEFAPNPGYSFEIYLLNSSGNMFALGVWSGPPNKLHFQVVGDGKNLCLKELPLKGNSGVLKAQLTIKTGTLQGFYKENPDDEWLEATGSPFILKSLKQGPYIVMVKVHNYMLPGPGSVKLDYVNIVTPAKKAGSHTAKTSEKKKTK